MPRKGRRRLVGKWAAVAQRLREAALEALRRELHAEQRRRKRTGN
ncbi:hypothetical protein ABZU53_11130 [Micromonospora sp. NPDC005194]